MHPHFGLNRPSFPHRHASRRPGFPPGLFRLGLSLPLLVVLMGCSGSVVASSPLPAGEPGGITPSSPARPLTTPVGEFTLAEANGALALSEQLIDLTLRNRSLYTPEQPYNAWPVLEDLMTPALHARLAALAGAPSRSDAEAAELSGFVLGLGPDGKLRIAPNATVEFITDPRFNLTPVTHEGQSALAITWEATVEFPARLTQPSGSSSAVLEQVSRDQRYVFVRDESAPTGMLLAASTGLVSYRTLTLEGEPILLPSPSGAASPATAVLPTSAVLPTGAGPPTGVGPPTTPLLPTAPLLPASAGSLDG